MRISIRVRSSLLLVLLVMAAFFASRSVANAQKAKPADLQPRAELAVQYNYERSNAPPGGCTCFSLNGASASFAWPVKPGGFALVGDVGVAHAGSITSSGLSLTLSTFTAGTRYLPRLGASKVQPFGQVLVGFAHSGGTLVSGTNTSVSNAGAAFAATMGGGVDLRLNRRFSVRMVEADYLLTTFKNGDNDHQNNLRLSAGAVFHF